MSTRTFHLLFPSPESLEKHNIISEVSQKDYIGFFLPYSACLPFTGEICGFFWKQTHLIKHAPQTGTETLQTEQKYPAVGCCDEGLMSETRRMLWLAPPVDPNHPRRLLAWLETMQLLFNLQTVHIFLMMFTPSYRSVPCHWPDNCHRVCSCLGFFNLAVYIQQHNGLSPTQKHLRVINWERGGGELRYTVMILQRFLFSFLLS